MRSLATRIGEAAATTIPDSAFPLCSKNALAGATNTSGRPLLCATVSVSDDELPMSIAPESTPEAIAALKLIGCMRTSSPALAKRPSSCA